MNLIGRLAVIILLCTMLTAKIDSTSAQASVEITTSLRLEIPQSLCAETTRCFITTRLSRDQNSLYLFNQLNEDLTIFNEDGEIRQFNLTTLLSMPPTNIGAPVDFDFVPYSENEMMILARGDLYRYNLETGEQTALASGIRTCNVVNRPIYGFTAFSSGERLVVCRNFSSEPHPTLDPTIGSRWYSFSTFDLQTQEFQEFGAMIGAISSNNPWRTVRAGMDDYVYLQSSFVFESLPTDQERLPMTEYVIRRSLQGQSWELIHFPSRTSPDGNVMMSVLVAVEPDSNMYFHASWFEPETQIVHFEYFKVSPTGEIIWVLNNDNFSGFATLLGVTATGGLLFLETPNSDTVLYRLQEYNVTVHQ